MTLNIHTTSTRKTIVVDAAETTPRQICEEYSIDPERYPVLLGAEKLNGDDYDMTFEELGCLNNDFVWLNATVKADSAAC